MTIHDTLVYINTTYESISAQFNRIPGSAIVLRYVKSSYQNDPIRSFLELCLFLFAVRYFLASKYSYSKKDFIKLSDHEINELVEEWQPEPLVAPLDEAGQAEVEKIPIIIGPQGPKVKLASGKSVMNLASMNLLNLLANEDLKEVASKTIRDYGVGTCGPAGFYGYLDVHIQTEKDLAAFLGVESAILYAQNFSTFVSAIPAFSKRGDIIVVDTGVSLPIQKSVLISRSTIRWYKHNDMKDLERVLREVNQQFRGQPLTRRFIVTEGLFSDTGDIADLPTIIELKRKYKWRLILDESNSIGVIGKTGRGLSEYYDIPATDIDMILGSFSGSMVAGGGFCAGSKHVIYHQRINALGYVFSASLPGYLAATVSCSIGIMQKSPELFNQLISNSRVFRAVIDRSQFVYSPSDPDSPIIHLFIKEEVMDSRKIDDEAKLLQDVVDECVNNGVLITRHKVIPSQTVFPTTPSLKICITTGLTKRETEKCAAVVKAGISKIISKVPKI
ncbi:pyridoxal phosphate-dependent transferase [Dipodascopsis uninucleata]